MKQIILWVILLTMPARSIPVYAAPSVQSSARLTAGLTEDPQVRVALDWLQKIPAPSFQESARAIAVKSLFEQAGLHTEIDQVGNVIAKLPGANQAASQSHNKTSTNGDRQDQDTVILSAHLDTVFPAGTDVKVRHENDRWIAPGISDNGTGLAALVAIARAVQAAHIKPQVNILFVANVGEEGEGNLRGMRALVDTYGPRLKGAIVLDGSSTDHVTTKALASRRLEAVITGPGGHSWSDFGLPNPINAVARASVRFISTKVPASPRTTFNLGQIEGGTSINSIPYEARLKVDIRSESEPELTRLETALRDCIAAGVRDEMDNSRDRSKGKLDFKVELLGSRPGGELRQDSPLLAALKAADDYVGNQSRPERSSTDANIPLSQGIDAISIGAGGNGGGAHSLQEWYEPAGRESGLQRALLTLLGFSGIANGAPR
jgi:acetylornithine deacetylase/succinyl-diaminopimelate desuccinylase-like protein